MSKVNEYTNSVQHNVIGTVINKLNATNGLTYKDKTTNKIVDNPNVKISTLNAMCQILDVIHDLGYQITKIPKKH